MEGVAGIVDWIRVGESGINALVAVTYITRVAEGRLGGLR